MVHSGVPRLREGRRSMPKDPRCTVLVLMSYIDMQTAVSCPGLDRSMDNIGMITNLCEE